MSSRTEAEHDSDALLDGEAVREALEQFDTLVDLDRRVEDAAEVTPSPEPQAAKDVEPCTDPEVGPDIESEIEADIETEILPDVESEISPDFETVSGRRPEPVSGPSEIERQVDTSLLENEPVPVTTVAERPRLVPRSAEPELIGIDGDALAWADDSSGKSRFGLAGAAVAVLVIGAAAVVFVPGWLQRNAAPDAPTPQEIADVNPVAYRAPKPGAAPLLQVAPPQSGAIPDEPLPSIPAVPARLEAPQLLAPTEEPLSVRVAALTPPTATAVTPAPKKADPGTAPRAMGRVEPVFTAADILEQPGSRIVLRVLVDERGAPIRVMVEEGAPGTAAVAKAIDAILRSRYAAGQRQGEPVRAWVLETFELPSPG